MADTYADFLGELSKRTGASVEQSELAALQGKSPEDVDAYKKALETQYAQRGSNTPGGSSGGGAAPAPAAAAPPAQAWNTSGNMFPDWYQGLMQQQVAQQQATQAENKAKSDALYGQLSQRANQGLQVNASDPV